MVEREYALEAVVRAKARPVLGANAAAADEDAAKSAPEIMVNVFMEPLAAIDLLL